MAEPRKSGVKPLESDGPADLTTWPAGRLLSFAARLVEQEWNGYLSGHGLTHAGFMALHFLDADRTQRELAAACWVEEQTMKRVLDRLERSGHVTRRRDRQDRRRLVVHRTPSGQAVYDTAMHDDVADSIVTTNVDDVDALRDELATLVLRLLRRRGLTGHEVLDAEGG